jgi:hypothetical protein
MFSHRFVCLSLLFTCVRALARDAGLLLCRVAISEHIEFRCAVAVQAESSALPAEVFVRVFLLRKWPPSCL